MSFDSLRPYFAPIGVAFLRFASAFWPALLRYIAPVLGALAFALLLIELTLNLSHVALRNAVNGVHVNLWAQLDTPAARIFLLLAMLGGLTTLLCLQPPAAAANPVEKSNALFTRYLIGLGYFMLVIAMANMVGLVGIAQNGYLDRVLQMGGAQNLMTGIPMYSDGTVVTGPILSPYSNAVFHRANDVLQGAVLLAALSMTVLGALFYFAKSLWEKLKDPDVLFNENVFWGGLWFRLGEAIVLTIAVFLYLRYANRKDLVGYLPMIGLFVGMTVKTSETLVFGFAEKILEMVSNLMGTPRKPTPTGGGTPASNPAGGAGGSGGLGNGGNGAAPGTPPPHIDVVMKVPDKPMVQIQGRNLSNQTRVRLNNQEIPPEKVILVPRAPDNNGQATVLEIQVGEVDMSLLKVTVANPDAQEATWPK